MKQQMMWVTVDGKSFLDHTEAEKHEAEVELVGLINKLHFSKDDTIDRYDLSNLLVSHAKEFVLKLIPFTDLFLDERCIDESEGQIEETKNHNDEFEDDDITF